MRFQRAGEGVFRKRGANSQLWAALRVLGRDNDQRGIVEVIIFEQF